MNDNRKSSVRLARYVSRRSQISVWMNYYMKFGRSEFRKVLNYINERLTRWVCVSTRVSPRVRSLAERMNGLVEYAVHNRNVFSHWV